MKVVVLAAGYGTRLQKDIQNKPQYNHLIGVPKPLLPLNKRPLLSRWLDLIRQVPSINIERDVVIITNEHYYQAFLKWAREYGFPERNIVNDGSTTNDNRFGAIGDIRFALQYFPNELKQDISGQEVMIIGGDTLFSNDFDLSHEVSLFSGKAPTILFYELDSSVNANEKGIVDVKASEDGQSFQVIRFIEKPKPNETSSRLACPCFYLLDAASVSMIDRFLDQTQDNNMRDAPGHFVRFVCENVSRVNARRIMRRFDVGHLGDYEEANRYFEETESEH